MVKHTQTINRQIANELFECVWSFCEIVSKRVKDIVTPVGFVIVSQEKTLMDESLMCLKKFVKLMLKKPKGIRPSIIYSDWSWSIIYDI